MPLFEKDHSDVWANLAANEMKLANDAFLNKLRDLTGVTQGFLCNDGGEILGAYPTGDSNPTHAADLRAQLAQWLATYQAQGKPPREIEMRCERGGMFVRVLNHAFAFVVCEPNLDWAMLRMSLNVAAAAYEAEKVRTAQFMENLARLD